MVTFNLLERNLFMKRLLFISLILPAAIFTGCQGPSSKDIPGYKLVFADEFDGTKIDASSWTHEVGDRWHNREQQAYTDRPANSYVKDGNLYKTVNNWWTGSKTDNGSFPAPFDQKFHILLNVAVGGSYVRCVEPSCVTATFPQKMYIDHVRVYQKSY